MDISERAARIGALADQTRRALYDYVAAQPQAIGREAAADAVGIPPHTARFHLDRLVDAGLLETEFRRLGGRSGPGAGRPSKLYRRVRATVALSVPERRYDLIGHVLAQVIERTGHGVALDDALAGVARDEGLRTASRIDGLEADHLTRAATALGALGFEPRADTGSLTLVNCPFDSLAREHTALVCTANHGFVGGLLEGLGCTTLAAHPEPHDGHCCVSVRSR